MPVLADFEIIALASNPDLKMVCPFDPNLLKVKRDEDGVERPAQVLVQPASLDIRVGLTAKRLLPPSHPDFHPLEPRFEDIDLSSYSKKDPYLMLPGDRLLVASLETFNLPKKVCGQVFLRSTPARAFLQHLHAGFLDPGWSNSVLTMEFANWGHTPIPFYPGASYTQVVFYWLNEVPTTLYYGKYNNDRCVSEGKNG